MDDKQRAQLRLKRQTQRKGKKAAKAFLIAVSVIVLAASAFFITVKICDPDFEIQSIIPQEKVAGVVSFVKEDIFGQTTQPSTTQAPSEPEKYDYTQFSDFAFNTAMQGNQVGNLLNNTKGAVTYSAAYVYYSIEGSGIYRFEPNEETNAEVLADSCNYKYLNILGDYIYFVDTDSNMLKRSSVDGGEIKDVAENISFAYLYNDKIYYIGTDNTVGYISINDFTKKELYSAVTSKRLAFAGISLSRVFFTQHDIVTDEYEYLTVDINRKNDVGSFMNSTKGDEVVNLSMEGGYIYYYAKQTDGTYDLIRKKFGSDKMLTMAEECTFTDYPVVYSNRLYYTQLMGSTLSAVELNMNSMDSKIMVSMNNADNTAVAGVGYGYQYVYIFGRPTVSASMQYRGSCIYTSASDKNTVKFENGRWKY